MSYRILVNREECEVRVAFLHDQTLVELHNEKLGDRTIVNNIYRGKVQDVVPGLQAAFIDVGLERNMFLHFMDIRPESLVLHEDDVEQAMEDASNQNMPGRIQRKGRRPRQDPNAPQAAAPVRKGDHLIVQVVKDEIGGKAPRVTTNLSLAGRFLVLLPFPSQEGGVSRKIAQGQDRFRLKRLLADLKSTDYSYIVRTAGIDQPDEAIRKDAQALGHLWESILHRYRKLGRPGLVNNDDDLLARLVRDAFPSDVNEVICDSHDDAEKIQQTLMESIPEAANKVKVYNGVTNIFDAYGAEAQINKVMDRKIWLKSGGYLIIDENEALTAIDVNTGRFTGKKDQEKTSLKTNLEACEEVAKAIRLRDIGGIIVIDFIDMLSRQHQEKVAEELRKEIRHDRAKTAIGRIGDFGLMMLTRKRQRMSLQNTIYDECPYCKGSGLVKEQDETFRKLKYDIRQALNGTKPVGAFLIHANHRLIESCKLRFKHFFERIRNEFKVDFHYSTAADCHLDDYQLTPILRAADDAVRLPAVRFEESVRLLPAVELDPRLLANPTIVDPYSSKTAAQGDLFELESEEVLERLPAEQVTDSEDDEEWEEEEDVADVEERPARPAQRPAPQRTPPPPKIADHRARPAAAASTPEPRTPEQRLEESNRKKRRRESSAERRRRRRLARGGHEEGDTPLPIGTGAPAAPPRPPVSHPETVESVTGDLEDDFADDGPDEAPEGAAAGSPAVGDQPGSGKRRTRRGSRGGRARRRRMEAAAAAGTLPATGEVPPLQATVPSVSAPVEPITPAEPVSPAVADVARASDRDAEGSEGSRGGRRGGRRHRGRDRHASAPHVNADSTPAQIAPEPVPPTPVVPEPVAPPADEPSRRERRPRPVRKEKAKGAVVAKVAEVPPPPPAPPAPVVVEAVKPSEASPPKGRAPKKRATKVAKAAPPEPAPEVAIPKSKSSTRAKKPAKKETKPEVAPVAEEKPKRKPRAQKPKGE